jgi:hypothetical protein
VAEARPRWGALAVDSAVAARREPAARNHPAYSGILTRAIGFSPAGSPRQFRLIASRKGAPEHKVLGIPRVRREPPVFLIAGPSPKGPNINLRRSRRSRPLAPSLDRQAIFIRDFSLPSRCGSPRPPSPSRRTARSPPTSVVAGRLEHTQRALGGPRVP